MIRSRMSTLFIAAVLAAACVALTACSTDKTVAAPPGPPGPGPDALFQGTTNIVFFRETYEHSSVRHYRFSVDEPREVTYLLSFMHLKPMTNLMANFGYGDTSVKYEKRSGPPVVVEFHSKFPEMCKIHKPEYKYYTLPRDFYAEFRRLARKEGWHDLQ
jgi:hypothetical protein